LAIFAAGGVDAESRGRAGAAGREEQDERGCDEAGHGD
jgi:hypothetical protein